MFHLNIIQQDHLKHALHRLKVLQDLILFLKYLILALLPHTLTLEYLLKSRLLQLMFLNLQFYQGVVLLL